MAADEETTLAAIHRLYGEVVENVSKIKDARAHLKDIALQNDEWRDLQDDIKELSAKTQQAKKLLEADKDYQMVNSELAELKFKHKDLLEIMSHHLTHYRDETGNESIRDPEGDARQIIVDAKLGKPEAVLGDDKPARPSKKPLRGQVTMESQLEGYGTPGGRSVEISAPDGSSIKIDKDGTHRTPPKWPAKNKKQQEAK